jgi:hypothetical protein
LFAPFLVKAYPPLEHRIQAPSTKTERKKNKKRFDANKHACLSGPLPLPTFFLSSTQRPNDMKRQRPPTRGRRDSSSGRL